MEGSLHRPGTVWLYGKQNLKKGHALLEVRRIIKNRGFLRWNTRFQHVQPGTWVDYFAVVG